MEYLVIILLAMVAACGYLCGVRSKRWRVRKLKGKALPFDGRDDDRLEEIRGAWAAATPGPWYCMQFVDLFDIYDDHGSRISNCPKNRNFVGSSWEHIGWLLGLVDELEKRDREWSRPAQFTIHVDDSGGAPGKDATVAIFAGEGVLVASGQTDSTGNVRFMLDDGGCRASVHPEAAQQPCVLEESHGFTCRDVENPPATYCIPCSSRKESKK